MQTPKIDNRGKVTVSCLPPEITIERNSVSFSLGPVPFERGGKNKDGSFKAGYLGITPANGLTWDKLKSSAPFFRPDDGKAETHETSFISELFSFLNNNYFRPAWAEVSEKLGEPGKPLTPEQIETVKVQFREKLTAIINETRGEREKSSAQIQKLIDANNEVLKSHREQFAALKTLFGVSTLKELSALGDKLDDKQKSFLSTLQTLIDTGAKLKEEIGEAKAREEAARAKLSSDEKELSDLGLL